MTELWIALKSQPVPFWCLVFAFLAACFAATEEGETLTPLRKGRAIFFGTFFGLATVWIFCALIPYLERIQIPINAYLGAMGYNIGSGARNYSEAYRTDFLKFLKDLLLLKQTITNEKIDLPNSGDRPA